MEDRMWTSGAGAYAYESVRRRSPYPMAQARRPGLLTIWLALVVKVVVVGGLAFGSGFLGMIVTRSLGWVLAGHGAATPVTTGTALLS
jgi:hypothetical protein